MKRSGIGVLLILRHPEGENRSGIVAFFGAARTDIYETHDRRAENGGDFQTLRVRRGERTPGRWLKSR